MYIWANLILKNKLILTQSTVGLTEADVSDFL